MPTMDDLERAVKAGIITAEQNKQLAVFLGSAGAEMPHAARDEAPRFFRSFNDLFIGLGVVIFGYAMITIAGLIPDQMSSLKLAMPFISAGLFWLLAEWLTARRRITFPSIIIALIFAYTMATGFGGLYQSFYSSDIKITGSPFGVVLVTGFSMLAVGLFFTRFRLPFSILLFAGSIAVFLLSCLMALLGKDALLPYLRWIILALGLAIFALAMWFDTQDPLRTQRTSDHGFWLHLLAAPIITHSVLWTSLQPIIAAKAEPEMSANLMVFVVLGFFLVFSLIALIIDRRALLISSLGYAAMALGYVIYKFDIEGNMALVLTLLLIAALILTLGTGWYTLRRTVFSLLPDFSLNLKLPPLAK